MHCCTVTGRLSSHPFSPLYLSSHTRVLHVSYQILPTHHSLSANRILKTILILFRAFQARKGLMPPGSIPAHSFFSLSDTPYEVYPVCVWGVLRT